MLLYKIIFILCSPFICLLIGAISMDSIRAHRGSPFAIAGIFLALLLWVFPGFSINSLALDMFISKNISFNLAQFYYEFQMRSFKIMWVFFILSVNFIAISNMAVLAGLDNVFTRIDAFLSR